MMDSVPAGYVSCDGGIVLPYTLVEFAGNTFSRASLTHGMCIDPASFTVQNFLVEPFVISEFPVTKGEFLDWALSPKVSLTHLAAKAHWERFSDEDTAPDDVPIVTVTLLEAMWYADAHGAQLPYRSEWVCVATKQVESSAARLELEKRMLASANWAEGSTDWDSPDTFLVPVTMGSSPSWCGVRDMLGNAHEFTLSRAMAYGVDHDPSMRWSYMRCGARAQIRHPAFSGWITPFLLDESTGDDFRPGQIGIRLVLK